jgi:hypothetical protein
LASSPATVLTGRRWGRVVAAVEAVVESLIGARITRVDVPEFIEACRPYASGEMFTALLAGRWGRRGHARIVAVTHAGGQRRPQLAAALDRVSAVAQAFDQGAVCFEGAALDTGRDRYDLATA